MKLSLTALIALLSASSALLPDEKASVEDLARAARGSVVTIRSSDRRGEARGLGSGFVVRPDGVVATAFHVIGRGRAFTVTLPGGTEAVPRAILAHDESLDLALVQVEAPAGAGKLEAIALGDSSALQPGQAVFTVGNPLGFTASVAQGVVAARREVEGRDLIQVALPIEPGSSGSPLLDLQGKAVGLIAIKSGSSFGFAVPIDGLKRLLESARPTPMARWLTIGALDPGEWTPVGGGDWRQRAGRVLASGTGEGFGGRMLCLARSPAPAELFDVEVEVKLEDESGAAGLVFHADGGDVHHGFYPTNGSLRLTRFEGPDVFSWSILGTVPSETYRPGDWNRIRVRVEGPRISCSVNGAPVIAVEDAALSAGRVGLCKFRQPSAEFRGFRAARELPSRDDPAVATRALELAGPLLLRGDTASRDLEALLTLGEGGVRALRERSSTLEKEAARARSLADTLHRRAVEERLKSLLSVKEEEIDLLQSALILSRLDNPDLDPQPYRALLDRWAAEAREGLDPAAGEEERLRKLLDHLFVALAFHGSAGDYYHRSNSYLNEVLDDREGIPITLSIVLLEMGRRLGLQLEGVPAPGHFLVAWRPAGGEERLIDAFHGGKTITRAEAEILAGRSLEAGDLAPATKRSIIVRMLRNLYGVAEREQDLEGMLRYQEVVASLEVEPGPDRWARAVLRARAGRKHEALEDLQALLESASPEVDRDRVRELKALLEGAGER